MSRKWRETQRWDAEHLTGALIPVRLVLHTFSSIWFAVVLLVSIVLYGSLASIPIGLVALVPTWAVIVASVLVCIASGSFAGGLISGKIIPGSRRGLRFTAMLASVLVGGVVCFWAWSALLWPMLRFDPASGGGLRFFAGFVERYNATTLRRLPGFEMSELEFYSWWPMRLILVLFIVNLAVATIRRIEFSFKNIGVLTVHTGIIVIALGSVYYQSMKKEGDTLVRAGVPDAAGKPVIGPPVRGFYDNTYVALWVAQRAGPDGTPLWDPRRLRGVPRYNDYGLDAAPSIAGDASVFGPAEAIWGEPQRSLDLPVPKPSVIDPAMSAPRVDDDIGLRIVGYAEYAVPSESTIVVEGDGLDRVRAADRRPLRVIELLSRLPDEHGHVAEPDRPAFTFTLGPGEPARRISENDSIAVEYTIGMSPVRLAELLVPMPEGASNALVVEIPAAARADGEIPRAVVPATPGVRHEIGDTGWKVGVERVMPRPPFAIITPGYEGAISSVAIVEITPPDGRAYERWVYHRFNEINQDMVPTAGGRPARRDSDGAIRVSLIDASKLQLYFNEREPGAGVIDLIVREPAGRARLIENIGVGDRIRDVVEMIDFRVASAHDHAIVFEHPVPVPEQDRNPQKVGTHAQSMLAVEVTTDDVTSESGRWSTVVWVPYIQYLGIDESVQRTVRLPGGRRLTLQFGRVWHGFPGFAVQLVDFEMIAYDHRGSPRDYQSMVRVSPTTQNAGFEAYEHIVQLNAPLRAPYIWSQSRGLPANVGMRLTSGLNPNQFKLSQSGWDRDGWMQTQRMADAGQLKRPFARYTILQVGNNPGIHVIAFGGVLMSVGIPWAFYFKPWLVKREKRRLAESVRERHRGKKAEQPARTKTHTKEAAAETVEHA